MKKYILSCLSGKRGFLSWLSMWIPIWVILFYVGYIFGVVLIK